MLDAWMNFGAILFVQFLLFIAFAYYEKKTREVARILVRGVLIGIPIGLFFDLVLAKFLGVNSYVLGLGAFFLILNATLSYGLFSATVLLFRTSRLLHFCLPTILLMLVYEVANLFFPVWIWQFVVPPIPFLIVLSLGYIGGAFLVVITDRIFRFRSFQ